MKKVEMLRKKYPQFFYKGYSYEIKNGDLHISFDFALPAEVRRRRTKEGPIHNISFHPVVIIKNVSKDMLERVEMRTLENLIFHLGMMEIPSYWKATCSPEIVIEAGHLSKDQIHWWKDLMLKGMGEYFYKNKIDFTKPDFLKISSWQSLPKRDLGMPKSRLGNKVLVPVGGGKDAVVTLELLKRGKQHIIPFLLNPKREQEEILKIAGLKNPIVVTRTIDPKLLELNRKGYLNGHTPFSAYLAFLSVLCAVLFNTKYIAFSNERSSNEGNVRYLGKIINHQYSKSFAFEKKFRRYARTYLAKNVEYFSFLRPLYELQIAKIFARYPKYFPVFLSCNEARKTASGTKKPSGKWCGKCAKCLFVFIVLYPFVKKEHLIKIFKRDLFENRTLIPLMEELVGERTFKPFECVGTKKESAAALSLCSQKRGGKMPRHPILSSWNKKNFIPHNFARLIRK